MCEIHCGDKIKFPWTAKKGKVQYWNAVVVDDAGVEWVSLITGME